MTDDCRTQEDVHQARLRAGGRLWGLWAGFGSSARPLRAPFRLCRLRPSASSEWSLHCRTSRGVPLPHPGLAALNSDVR
eukprot:3533545-Alexandrium_andersonii.AAC.1